MAADPKALHVLAINCNVGGDDLLQSFRIADGYARASTSVGNHSDTTERPGTEGDGACLDQFEQRT